MTVTQGKPPIRLRSARLVCPRRSCAAIGPSGHVVMANGSGAEIWEGRRDRHSCNTLDLR